jgi:hypothetical protein
MNIYQVYKKVCEIKALNTTSEDLLLFNISNTHNLKNLKNTYLNIKHNLETLKETEITNLRNLKISNIVNGEYLISDNFKLFDIDQNQNKKQFKQIVYKNLIIETAINKHIQKLKYMAETTFYLLPCFKITGFIIESLTDKLESQSLSYCAYNGENLIIIKRHYEYIKFLDYAILGLKETIKLIDNRINIYNQDLKMIDYYLKGETNTQTLDNRLFKNATFIYLKNQLTLKETDIFKAIEKTIIHNL